MFNVVSNVWRRLAVALLLCGMFGLQAAPAQVTESYENRHDPGPPRNLAPPGVRSPLVILGTGNPVPNPHRFGPASAVVVNGKPYLFDAGEGVWRGLAKAATFHGGAIARAFQVDNLTHLFITHMHPDHTIGIPTLILQPWYLNRASPMDIYGPPGITHPPDPTNDHASHPASPYHPRPPHRQLRLLERHTPPLLRTHYIVRDAPHVRPFQTASCCCAASSISQRM